MGVKRKYLHVTRGNLVGVFVVAIAGTTFFSAESVVGKLVDRYRPELEQDLSEKLGHQLVIGEYKGLRSWGVSLGTTKLKEGYKDESSVKITDLGVQLAPFSSLLQRRPVLVFTGTGSRFDLKRNQDGAYWVMGPSTGNKPSNLEIRFKLKGPSKIFIEPSNLEVNATGQLALNLRNSKAKGNIRFGLPNNGSFNIKASGNWKELDLVADAGFKKVRLEVLEGILPAKFNLKTRGQVDGIFTLGVNEKGLNCNGNLVLSNLNLRGGGLKNALTTQRTAVSCKNEMIQVPFSEWKYGPLIADLNGELPLSNSSDLKLDLSTSVRLEKDPKQSLKVNSSLPFTVGKRGFLFKDLLAEFDLDSFALNNLNSSFDTSMSGNLSAKGTLKGPLSAINADFSFSLDNPQFDRIRLQEQWRGSFTGSTGGKGGELQMNSEGAAIPSKISARFGDDWKFNDLTMSRLGGQFTIRRTLERFRWKAKDLRLDRIEVAITPDKSFKRIFGKLSGDGVFDLNPLLVDGTLRFGYPRFMELKLKEAQLRGRYSEKNYSMKGELLPLDSGEVSINSEGRLGGPFWIKSRVKRVSPTWIVKSAIELPQINVDSPVPRGLAKDLGVVKINPDSSSLDSQLNAWIRSVIAVSNDKRLQRKNKIFDPEELRGYVDASIDIKGSELTKLTFGLDASGKLWTKEQENKKDFNVRPFTATLNGPLRAGEGEFLIANIPLSLLSLFAPSPSGITGMFGLAGKYRLGKGYPEVTADLVFDEFRLGNELLLLERGKFAYAKSILSMDIILKNSLSSEPLTIVGQLPFTKSLPINLRIESHGDGIDFLDEFLDTKIAWRSGSTDLRLLIRGSIDAPKANGFLVLKEADIVVNKQYINDINSTILFDFNRVEVQKFKAKIGRMGTFIAKGDIALFKSKEKERNPLSVEINNFNLKSSFSDVYVSSNLALRGSLVKPIIAGDVVIKEGSISTVRTDSKKKSVSVNKEINSSIREKRKLRPEEKWNQEDPLVLFIGNSNQPEADLLNSSIPDGLSWISFDNLKLRLGPRLKIVSPPLTTFEIDGFVYLNGNLDQTIKPNGSVEILSGTLNLFTTTFSLDKREYNVALFTPSRGLIPFVDVKLISRVPDTVRNVAGSYSQFSSNGSGAIGIGGSRFIKVEVIATGPADRLTENYRLRSKPPVPEDELLGLIGGNSLANLFDGGDSTLFAEVLTRSLLTPLLGNISDAFSERLQISLYPAYVNGSEVESEMADNSSTTNKEGNYGELSPQQAWVTEMGLDLTDRITFSIQATPNRDDIPSQGNITYQLNQNLDLLGSFDQDGNWQSQLEIFLRY